MLPYKETAFDNYFHTIRTTAKADGSYAFRANRQLFLVAAYSGFDRERSIYFKDLTTLEKILQSKDTTSFSNYLLRSWYNKSSRDDKLSYQTGIDLNHELGRGERIGGGGKDIGDYAMFVTAKYDILKAVSTQPGVRLIYNTKYDAPLVYSLNVKYSPTEHTSVRASYARGFRAPSLKELYLLFKDVNHDVAGNPDLKAEYSNNVSLSMNYLRETRKSYISFETSLYYNNVENLIQLIPLNKNTNPPLYGYINVGKMISRGGNLSGTWSLYPNLTVRAGYAVTGRKVPGNGGVAAYDKSQWNADITASASYKFMKAKTTLVTYFRRTGKYMLLTEDGYFDGSFIEGFNSMDVSAVKAFFGNRLSLSLGCKNLFDVTNVLASGSGGGAHGVGGSGDGSSTSVAWGRTYFVKVAFNFNTYQ
jgi:outer membrane receptor for ferrienterochelin and colicins